MTIDYIVSRRTNGANPFKIFESLINTDAGKLAFILKRMDYQVFLSSAYWFAVSSVAKSRAGNRCQVCNSEASINVHHRTYDTHGYEHTNMIDLIVLCENCHGLFHGHKSAEGVSQRMPRQKCKKEIVIPHDESLLQIPNSETITLTPELIDNCRANGSFTNATLRALGMTKSTMTRGWVQNLVGKILSRERYKEAARGKFVYHSGRLA